MAALDEKIKTQPIMGDNLSLSQPKQKRVHGDMGDNLSLSQPEQKRVHGGQ